MNVIRYRDEKYKPNSRFIDLEGMGKELTKLVDEISDPIEKIKATNAFMKQIKKELKDYHDMIIITTKGSAWDYEK